MSKPLDHVAHLAQTIGARPAGTEEEQQAAFYICDQIKQEAGLPADVEDFANIPNMQTTRLILCGVSVLFAALSLIVSQLGAVAFVVTLVCAALFAAEEAGRPLLSRFLGRGSVSQNVVARYEPSLSPDSRGTRRRKIVLVAHYDSGKVRPECSGLALKALPAAKWACMVGMVALPVLLLIRSVALGNPTGTVGVVLIVLVVLALVGPAVQVVLVLVDKVGEYNDGANCNATGAAALIEVARRVSRGADEEDDSGVVLHGEDAVAGSGLVPEGAELVYEAANVTPPDMEPMSPEARLASAKAAIAALSGKPVSGTYAPDLAENLVQVNDRLQPERGGAPAEDAAVQEAAPDAGAAGAAGFEGAAPVAGEAGPETVAEAAAAAPAAPAPAAAAQKASTVPAWFKAAQRKAKKPVDDKPVQRSRYAEALDAALAAQEEQAAREAEERRAAEEALAAQAERERQAALAAQEQAARLAAEQQAARDEAAAQAARDALYAEEAQGGLGAAPFPDVDDDPFEDGDFAPVGGEGAAPQFEALPEESAEIPLPSFLDQRAVQQQAQDARPDAARTSRRVDVTSVPIVTGSVIAPLPQEEDAAAQDEVRAQQQASARPSARSLTLPSLSASLPPVEPAKQRAPLAEAQTSSETAAKSLLNLLPTIEVPASGASGSAAEGAQQPATRESLRASLPSLSGVVSEQRAAEQAPAAGSDAPAVAGGGVNGEAPVGEELASGEEVQAAQPLGSADASPHGTASVSAVGSFAPAGATGAFAPVGDELIEDRAPDDIYVDDADDSVYDGATTATGAFAGPGYVDMPKSRVRSFFGRFGRGKKKKEEREQSAQEWLDVDDSFDAPSVGAERGGWESFQGEGDYYDDYPGDSDEGRWNGGAYSAARDEVGVDEFDAPDELLDEPEMLLDDELQQVRRFRGANVNTEVWFVALGAELSDNAGTKAFLDEHGNELKGSIIIDLEGLGGGELSLIDHEGCYRGVKTSSRMGRLVRKASQGTGLRVGGGRIPWTETSSSVAIRRGFQAMHLAGLEDGKPARYAQADDVLDKVDEATLEDDIDFVTELLRKI